MPNPSALIHLSDIECGENNRAASGTYDDAYKECANALIHDIKKNLNEKNVSTANAGLIITGDITNTAVREEFQVAIDFITYIQKKLGIPKELTAIVPGNHDVNWKSCLNKYNQKFPDITLKNGKLKAKNRTLTEDDLDRDTLKTIRNGRDKLFQFSKLLNEVCGIKDYVPQKVIPYDEFARLGVALIGMDTTYPCAFGDVNNYGRLSHEQVEKASDELKRILREKNGLIPIATFHHPPIEFKNNDESYLSNHEEVQSWLAEYGFSAVLCGHKHVTKAFDDLLDSTYCFIAGTFGLNAKELTQSISTGRAKSQDKQTDNQYSILIVEADKPERNTQLIVRKLNKPGAVDGKWIKDKSPKTPLTLLKPELRDDEKTFKEKTTLQCKQCKDIIFAYIQSDDHDTIYSVHYEYGDDKRIATEQFNGYPVDFPYNSEVKQSVTATVQVHSGVVIPLEEPIQTN